MLRWLKQFWFRRKANQQTARLFAVVAHELRRSLTIMASSADILQRSGDRLDPAKQARHWQRIQNQIIQLKQFLEAIAILAEPDQEALQAHREWIDVTTCCMSIIEEVQMETQAHTLTLTINGASVPQLHEPVEQILAYLDQQQIRIILINLLSNSIKYSPNGGIIRLEVYDANHQLKFRVRDSGIGIAQREQAEIFQPFYRGSNTHSFPGSGLGLSLVKQLVHAQSGKISITSTLDLGTTFTVTLPRISPRDESKSA
jgi:two-component system, sensor histidine kinase LadS